MKLDVKEGYVEHACWKTNLLEEIMLWFLKNSVVMNNLLVIEGNLSVHVVQANPRKNIPGKSVRLIPPTAKLIDRKGSGTYVYLPCWIYSSADYRKQPSSSSARSPQPTQKKFRLICWRVLEVINGQQIQDGYHSRHIGWPTVLVIEIWATK
jgi:hypothetical protein